MLYPYYVYSLHNPFFSLPIKKLIDLAPLPLASLLSYNKSMSFPEYAQPFKTQKVIYGLKSLVLCSRHNTFRWLEESSGKSWPDGPGCRRHGLTSC